MNDGRDASLRVLLVDDEPLALARLEVGFRDIPGAVVVGTAQDGDEALERIASLRPDVVFLDIMMPGRDGLEVAGALMDADAPDVVFVTAYDHFAPDAFAIDAADYLLKPVRFERLRAAMERVRLRRLERTAGSRAGALEPMATAPHKGMEHVSSRPPGYETELLAAGSNGPVRVAIASIIWIEAARDYVILHTPARSLILRETMSRLEARLDPTQIVRVHRSAFVNALAVTSMHTQVDGHVTLTLQDGQHVLVSPNYTRRLGQLNLGRPGVRPT